MAKDGRLYVPLDVNWYDEWGHAVSAEAALLWVLALTACKRMRNDGVLTISQLRRLAPSSTTDERFASLVAELIGCDIAPMSGDDRTIVVHGWSEWNDTTETSRKASEAARRGNHVRWHVNEGSPSDTCDLCLRENSSGESIVTIAPRSGPDRTTRSLSREEKSREEKRDPSTPSPAFEAAFDECWTVYPRKIARKAALKAYIAQRRKGTGADVLLAATRHFAEAMKREDRPTDRILHGSTFYGPDDRWEDYVKAPKREVIAAGAGALRLDEYEAEMGERVLLPGEVA